MARKTTVDLANMTREQYNAYEAQKWHEREKRLAVQRSYDARGIAIKVCNKCNEPRPRTVEFFTTSTVTKDGFGHTCSQCRYAEIVDKEWTPEKRAKVRQATFKNKHGYSREERDAALANIKHCEICGSMKLLVIDHCHDNKKMRGTLCTPCNTGMGQLDDNPDLLEAAAAYLHKSGNHRSGPRRGMKSEKWRALKKALTNTHSAPDP